MRTKAEIANDNDLFRNTLIASPRHKLVLTEGIQNLQLSETAGQTNEFSKLVSAVRNFKKFTEDNDPHGEHDLGKVVVGENEYYWKIDYYDFDFQKGLDPHEAVTALVLTIMRTDEY